ncbi:MAG: hypothetical protein PWQ87_765 [Candidatus Woesearchaeota archaeon]|nr:hypothetical protein [Candidatus Woesearchaeota archaeon]
MRFNTIESSDGLNKRILLLAIIIVVVLIIGLVIFYILDSMAPLKNENPKEVINETNEPEFEDETPEITENQLDFDVYLINGYDKMTLKPTIRESSNYLWGEEVMLYINISGFDFIMTRNSKFVMLEMNIKTTDPTGKEVYMFSKNVSIEDSFPYEVNYLPYVFTIDSNYPQLYIYGTEGRFKVDIKVKDLVGENEKTKTIYFYLNNW